MHILLDFDAYRRNLANPLCTFMQNIWLLEPALEGYINMAVCKNEVSQMRDCVLFPLILSVGNVVAISVFKNVQEEVGTVWQLYL